MEDRKLLVEQLRRIVSESPLTDKVRAIYFGIFTRVRPDGREHPQLYVVGSPEFDPNSDGWACPDERFWEPEGRLLELPNLQSMDPEAWQQVEGYCQTLLVEAKGEIQTIFQGSPARPVAVGHDDGELTVLYRAAA